MPKEFINCEHYGREVPPAQDGDGPVQLERMPTLAGSVIWLKDGKHVAVRIVDREKDPDGFENRLGDLNLDRAGINRMIRSLRKARDDAFGKDE